MKGSPPVGYKFHFVTANTFPTCATFHPWTLPAGHAWPRRQLIVAVPSELLHQEGASVLQNHRGIKMSRKLNSHANRKIDFRCHSASSFGKRSKTIARGQSFVFFCHCASLGNLNVMRGQHRPRGGAELGIFEKFSAITENGVEDVPNDSMKALYQNLREIGPITSICRGHCQLDPPRPGPLLDFC